MAELHLALAILAGGLAAGGLAAGLALAVQGRGPNRALLGLLGLLVGVALLDGIVGLVRLTSGDAPHDPLHVLYGAAVVLVVPVAVGLAVGRSPRHQAAILATAALVALGLVLRLAQTGA